MAIAITLVQSRPNWLRYLLVADGVDPNGTITTTGAASPDLRTDSAQGPIHKLAKAFADGFGQFAAGAKTQAQARALWLSDWSGVGGDPGNENQTTARCRLVRRGGLTAGASGQVDANVDGAGNPILEIFISNDGGGGDYYLDVEVPQAID